MNRRRRAILLVEMLTVLAIIGVAGSLMVLALASIQRSQKRVAAFDNRYVVLNDFLYHLARDVRAVRSAAMHEPADDSARQVLVLGEPPNQVTYRFHEGAAERTGHEGDRIADKQWDSIHASAAIIDGDIQRKSGSLVSLTVLWPRTGSDPHEPSRRFDLTVRCAGVIPYGEK